MERIFTCPRCYESRVVEITENAITIEGNLTCDLNHRDEEFSGKEAANRFALTLANIERSRGESLADMHLPPHYAYTLTADGAELLLPNGNVLHHYGPAFSPETIQDDAWAHAREVEEVVENADRVMGRGKYRQGSTRPSVHDLLSEALDATGWTGAEKQAFLESFYAALERDVQRRFGVSG